MSEQNGSANPTITIVLTGQGQVAVKGPIKDRVLAYGMLGAAYEAIMEFHRKDADKRTPIIGSDRGTE